jgi:hypothetical protein
MDFNDERDDLADDDDVTTHRDRAREILTEIAQQVKQALADQGIDLALFFLVPSSGPIVIFGCPGDPDDHLWDRAGEIVAAIVRQTVGLDGTRCRAVTCATTDTVSMHPPALPLSGAEV